MRITTLGRALALGFIYVAAFALIVLVQFPAAGPSTVAAAGVSLRTAPGPKGDGLSSAELSAAGLRLAFSGRAPLVYQNEGGEVVRARPRSFKLDASGIDLSFEDGSALSVRSDFSGRFTWSLATPVKVKSVVLRFSPARGARILPPREDGSPRIKTADAIYALGGFGAGTELGELAMIVSRGAARPFSAVPEKKDSSGQPAQFLAQVPMDPALWSGLLSAYLGKAWAGLSGDDFDPARAVWKTADGFGFDEARFVAYMAEALRRNLMTEAGALAAAVRANHLESITSLGVPFAGRTAAAMSAYEQANLAEVKEAERLVQARSADLFYRRGIVPLLFDRAPYALAQEAMGMARAVDLAASTPLQALRVIQDYLDARTYLSDAENPFAKATDLADRVLAPAVRKLGNAYFLETGPGGTCDLALGLEAGFALIRLGGASGKSIYEGIGQSLVSSALDLSDPAGSLPARVALKNGEAQASEERLSAAAVYPLLGQSPYYPHGVSFFKELGPGSWVWTSSPAVRLAFSPERVVFSCDYPEGSSHYLTVYGVKPFARIQLYGLDYNMDTGFEGYNASGYYFKKASGALYVKMRHKAKTEEIRLFY